MLPKSSSKRGALFFLLSIFSSLLLFSSISATALATPVDDYAALEKREKWIPTNAEIKHFIQGDNFRELSSFANKDQPARDKAIFFTGQDNKAVNKIIRWATDKERGLTGIRNIWRNLNLPARKQYPDTNDADFYQY